MTDTEYLMKSPAMMDVIRQGEEDIKNGRYTTIKEEETAEQFLERSMKEY